VSVRAAGESTAPNRAPPTEKVASDSGLVLTMDPVCTCTAGRAAGTAALGAEALPAHTPAAAEAERMATAAVTRHMERGVALRVLILMAPAVVLMWPSFGSVTAG
jgi:hypothetical protein